MNSSPTTDFLSGIVGAIASVYVGQPLDTIKVKLQTFSNKYQNAFDCFRQTLLHEGIHGLYRGTIPSLLSNAAENGILFMAYGRCQNLMCILDGKTNIEKLSTFEHSIAGGLSAFFSSIALCPTELIKCRMQTLREVQTMMMTTTTSTSSIASTQLPKIISPFTITRNILRTEGIRGLFVGLTSTWARECPGYACFFGGYELTRSILTRGQTTKTDIGRLKTWISGGVAGICFWTVMFPIDAVKSRVQVLKPNMTFPKYTLEIIRNEGLTTLYAGLVPTLIRTFIATGALFITYEEVRSILSHSI